MSVTKDGKQKSGHKHRVDAALIAKIEERIRQGLAPPPEVYQAHIRDKIDWAQLPSWATPLDPDLFEGSAHEG